MNDSLVANKWYPHYKGPGRTYTIPYPTPQSVLRQAVGAAEYKFVSETVTTEHIRAAVVLPPDVPFEHLLDEPWSMSYCTDDWRMLIVSTLDPLRWIELARASGATAWLKGHHQTYTYNWEPPVRDHTGNKIRPGNALGITGQPEYTKDGRKLRKDRGRPKKFDREALLDDLRENKKTHVELATKHNVSRITVHTFARRNGFTKIKDNVKT
jgi:hypothetical protein